MTLNAAVHFADVDVVIAHVHLLSIAANVTISAAVINVVLFLLPLCNF